MTGKRRLITLDDMVADPYGPVVRVTDLRRITGFNQRTLLREVEFGRLNAYQVSEPGGCYFVSRVDAIRWLVDRGFLQSKAS